MSSGQDGDGSEERLPPYSMADLAASLPGLGGLSVADHAGLVNVLKDKLDFLAGQSSGSIESLSPKVKRRVTVLQEIQKQHNEVEAKFILEKAELEAKYQSLYEPFYRKRYDIITGAVEVDVQIPETDATTQEDNIDGTGVPEFWLTAMKTNEILAMQITEHDEGALRFLKDIKHSFLESAKGFKLEFYFDENPYFKNTVLTKTYHMIDDIEPILEQATGTEIEWHPGKNLMQKVVKKKPKKGAKNVKPVTKTEKCESFFDFFYPPKIPDDDDDDEIDQEIAEKLQDLMEQDYDIGSTIRDKIIPHAVSWFTGEALQGDELDDGDAEDEDENEDEDEDEVEDEDEDEDEEQANKKSVQRNITPSQGVDQPPECKQQ